MNQDVDAIVDAVCDTNTLTNARRETLISAVALGADNATLAILATALRVSPCSTIILPQHEYESRSGGRGWARLGRGTNAQWGDREPDGYRVGAGVWTVGGARPARKGERKAEDMWDVKHVQVGAAVWTIAN